MGSLTRIGVLAVLAAVAAALVFLLAHGGSAPSLAPQRPLSVRASFDQRRIDFADRLLARVVVRLDRRRVDASRLKVRQSLFPFTVAGPSRTTRTTRGRVLVVTTETPFTCVQETCLTDRPKNTRVFRFAPVRVSAADRGGRELTVKAAWPEISMQRRVSEDEARTRPPPFRAYLAPPPPNYRISPSLLALLLEIAAAVLAAAGVVVAGLSFAAVRHARGPRQKQLDELERAIAYAREARARPPEDRRKAAGLLARLLGMRHEPLAGSAERLAWSRPAPTPDALGELVTTTEQEVNGRR
jgi:hypothetical protein